MKGIQLIARVDSEPGFRVGGELILKPVIEKSHFFDPQSQKRI